MTMIRNTMLGLSLLAMSATSALAAPVAMHHTTRVVAEDAAPATDKPAKPAKKAKKAKKAPKDAAPAPETK
jgi:hypothetical protein